MYYLEGKNKPTVPKKILISKETKWPMLVVDYDVQGKVYHGNEFEISGLALEFSRLKKDKDILEFASTHGMLGVESKENIPHLGYDYEYLNKFKLDENSHVEFLDEWHWHIDHVRKLLKLFDALQNNLPIEDELLKIDKRQNLYSPTREIPASYTYVPQPPQPGMKSNAEPYVEPEYHIYWAVDNKPTARYYSKMESAKTIEEEYRYHAWLVLEAHIKPIIEKSIIIDFSSVRADKKAAFGFSYVDRKATKYLLAAIYYDLYRIVNNIDEVIDFCPICGGPFKSKRKGTMYCSNACKQEKKRQSKEEVNENG